MANEAKLFFWDAGGKFDAAKADVQDFCRSNIGRKYDVTIYSLTPRDSRTPERLIVKMTPIGRGDSYLSMRQMNVNQAMVAMATLDYQTVPVEKLRHVCRCLATSFMFMENSNGGAHIYEYDEYMNKTSVEKFFSMNPRRFETGSQIYLRDKEHFMSLLPDPKNPSFEVLPLLTDEQKKEVISIDMSGAKVNSMWGMVSRFSGYKKLRRLDLSMLDTSHISNMRMAFCGCESLESLDLSTFDFKRVEHMDDMFTGCTNLKEVILSDTVLGAGRVPRRRTRRPSVEELNDLYFDVYRSAGPGPADVAVERASSETEYVPLRMVTDEERYRYLGLEYGKQKLVIVPHKRRKNG